MRLEAGISLLHLSEVETFFNAIAPKFLRLACMVMVCTCSMLAYHMLMCIIFPGYIRERSRCIFDEAHYPFATTETPSSIQLDTLFDPARPR